jgi:hypothetical protein
MADQSIICPKCGVKVSLGGAVLQPIMDRMRKDIEGDTRKRELELAKKEKQLNTLQKNIDKRVDDGIAKGLRKEEVKLRTRITEEHELDIKDLQNIIDEKTRKLEDTEKHELEIRKKMRELEGREKNLELDTQRRIQEEKKKIEDDVRKQVHEENELKEREHFDTIEGMKKQVEELKQKLQQGSQQQQGEVLETLLEDTLRDCFPGDLIESVPKGIEGPDIVQKVCKSSGEICGIIAWELKRTKNWSDKWVDKIKEDLTPLNAEIGVIVSVALPPDVRNFSIIKGVVVSSTDCFIPVAMMLRRQIVDGYRQKQAAVNSAEKKDMIYEYLLSEQFRQRVEAIAEPLILLKSDLEKEIRSLTRNWGKQQKQIEKAFKGVARMYGEMQGIVGNNLPDVRTLALPSATEFEEAPENQEEDDGRNG